jgi:hypothetical protein
MGKVKVLNMVEDKPRGDAVVAHHPRRLRSDS